MNGNMDVHTHTHTHTCKQCCLCLMQSTPLHWNACADECLTSWNLLREWKNIFCDFCYKQPGNAPKYSGVNVHDFQWLAFPLKKKKKSGLRFWKHCLYRDQKKYQYLTINFSYRDLISYSACCRGACCSFPSVLSEENKQRFPVTAVRWVAQC